MKIFQALYNEDSNKLVEQAEQERATRGNLSFLIDLATIAMVTEDTKPIDDEP